MMLKEYRNKETFKAEQFDGSEEMKTQFHIRRYRKSQNGKTATGYVLSAPGRLWRISVGDWIVSGNNFVCKVISNNEFKKTYEEVE